MVSSLQKKTNYVAEGLSLLTSQFQRARPFSAVTNNALAVSTTLSAWAAAAVAASAWQPRNATSATCVLQLDADVGVTGSGATLAWADQSGAGIVTSAIPYGGGAPTYTTAGADFGGKNYFSFGGANALYFANTGSGSATDIFVTGASSAGTLGARVINRSTGFAGFIGRYQSIADWYLGNSGGSPTYVYSCFGNTIGSGAQSNTGLPPGTDIAVITTFSAPANNVSMYIANTLQTTTGVTPGTQTDTSDAICIGALTPSGAGEPLTGSIRRIAAFQGVLSATERALFNTWLQG